MTVVENVTNGEASQYVQIKLLPPTAAEKRQNIIANIVLVDDVHQQISSNGATTVIPYIDGNDEDTGSLSPDCIKDNNNKLNAMGPTKQKFQCPFCSKESYLLSDKKRSCCNRWLCCCFPGCYRKCCNCGKGRRPSKDNPIGGGYCSNCGAYLENSDCVTDIKKNEKEKGNENQENEKNNN